MEGKSRVLVVNGNYNLNQTVRAVFSKSTIDDQNLESSFFFVSYKRKVCPSLGSRNDSDEDFCKVLYNHDSAPGSH